MAASEAPSCPTSRLRSATFSDATRMKPPARLGCSPRVGRRASAGEGDASEPTLDLGFAARKLGQISRSLICLTGHTRADPSTPDRCGDPFIFKNDIKKSLKKRAAIGAEGDGEHRTPHGKTFAVRANAARRTGVLLPLEAFAKRTWAGVPPLLSGLALGPEEDGDGAAAAKGGFQRLRPRLAGRQIPAIEKHRQRPGRSVPVRCARPPHGRAIDS